MNQFQKFLMDKNNKQLILDIIELYHPLLGDKESNRVKITPKHDWICLNSSIVSIGLEFNNPIDYLGEGHRMEVVENIIKTSNFKAWRFYDDSLYKNTKVINDKFIEDNNPDINELFVKYNVPRPTAKELYNYYYSN